MKIILKLYLKVTVRKNYYKQNYRFVDARHYFPANYNLDTYIKAYTGKCEKYVFPYKKKYFC